MIIRNFYPAPLEQWGYNEPPTLSANQSRKMVKVRIGEVYDGTQSQDVFEVMYEDILNGIKNGFYQVGFYFGCSPQILVYINGEQVPHSEEYANEEKLLCEIFTKIAEEKKQKETLLVALDEAGKAMELGTPFGFAANNMAIQLQSIAKKATPYPIPFIHTIATSFFETREREQLYSPNDEKINNLIAENEKPILYDLVRVEKRMMERRDFFTNHPEFEGMEYAKVLAEAFLFLARNKIVEK